MQGRPVREGPGQCMPKSARSSVLGTYRTALAGRLTEGIHPPLQVSATPCAAPPLLPVQGAYVIVRDPKHFARILDFM